MNYKIELSTDITAENLQEATEIFRNIANAVKLDGKIQSGKYTSLVQNKYFEVVGIVTVTVE